MPVPGSKENNFDLLRLVAAIQIASYHAFDHLHFSSAALNSIIYSFRYFFGIHILFTISGFLIFASYDRTPDARSYFRNRFLRVYPGLWVCLLVTIAIIAASGHLRFADLGGTDFWKWIIAQSSFFQFYTPQLLRPFGVHNPNGALWTIPVELTYYVFIPIFFWLAGRRTASRNAWMILLIALSLAYNILYQPYKFQADRSVLVKLMGINIAPYLFYFLLGALTANNWDRIRNWYEGKGLYWLTAYFGYCFIFCFHLHKFQIGYWTNTYHFVAILLLSQATIALAYTCKGLGNKLLLKNDFSYGIYIYHMPVINALLVAGYGGSNTALILTIIPVALLAYLSWRFIEKPALLLKVKLPQ